MQVKFKLNNAQTKFGQNLGIVGNKKCLGNWSGKQAALMATKKQMYPKWESKNLVNFDSKDECKAVEYKFIKIDDKGGDTIWEQGDNRKIDLSPFYDQFQGQNKILVVEDDGWDQKQRKAKVYPLDNDQSGPQSSSETHEEIKMDIINDSQNFQFQKPVQSTNKYIPVNGGEGCSQDAQNFIRELLDLNSKNITWKGKLETVNNLIQKYKNSGQNGFPTFNTEGLAIISAFLYFINSGQIKCGDQGHFRPNHQAGFAYNIYKTLDKDCLIINNIYDENGFFGQDENQQQVAVPSNCHIIRLLKTQLPSFADQFMCAVPMTRIRDIAHRNDIPKDLKNDIKHRLQNKLHRCAEPSDLKTCEELINRVRNGDYNGDFKQQFEIFYEELKDFFNAQGLDKILDSIKKDGSSGQISGQIDAFWHNKHVQKGITDQFGNFLQSITTLRSSLQNLNLRLVDDNGKKTLYQQTALADIELEKFLFMKVSEALNQYTSQGKLQNVMTTACSLIENMIISNMEQHIQYSELNCILREFRFNSNDQYYKPDERTFLLRIKASVERAERFSNLFTQEIINIFQENVMKLGQAINLDKHSVMVFSESFVRFHLIFQISKCMDFISQFIRNKLNLPPFVVVSQYKQTNNGGVCNGRVFHVKEVYDCLKLNHRNENIILFVDQSDGTEEIPTELIQAIILKHDLPQLSHLAIRARQTKILFVCCESENVYYQLKQQNSHESIKSVSIKNGNVQFANSQISNQNSQIGNQKLSLKDSSSQKIDLLDIQNRISKINCIDLIQQSNEKPKKDELGSKNYNSLILNLISNQLQDKNGDKVFEVPQLIGIPLTVPIKLFLSCKDENLKSQIDKLQNQIDESDSNNLDSIEKLRIDIQNKILKVYDSQSKELESISEYIQAQIQNKEEVYGKQQIQNELLAVRSSSTLEDLDKMAGAGLFDSILNVNLNDKNQIKDAIIGVWQSLYNKRAIISRKQNNISTQSAHMAILVQRMIESEISFIIHSVDPISDDQNIVYMELALGQGETLASANQSGTPFRLTYNKNTGNVTIISFSSYSYALYADQSSKNLVKKCNDNSQNEFYKNHKYLLSLGQELGQIACEIEKQFENQPQDIEGCISDSKIYIVQTRNQV